ncbi:MAG: thiamine pyrophosphate-dependent dehydrogenase E1 component subunit alpha [Acidobacteriia bacterium]|nr:thiamine pyrophosphate-dependent dehydrogenase E1 component subunit alpha [Terriglobia bacterium]
MLTAKRMTVEDLASAYRVMMLSRRFDEWLGELNHRGTPVPHYHSGVGQEALMVAAVTPLRRTDQMIYTHRGYGHLLAKGISLREIALDLFMKAGGTNHGLGGVMHVNRPDLGVPGREGVFGGRFAIAAGLALAAKLDGRDEVTVCFYGEAAGARGNLYEALNMVVLWNLPVIYVAENNGWSFSSRTEWLYPEGRMSRVWRGFEIPVEVIDGNDAEEVFATVSRAVARARAGEGPSVIEALTYRLEPHIWRDKAAYQPPDEIASWRRRDPIARAARRLLELGMNQNEIDSIACWAEDEVERTIAAVEAAPDATWEDGRHQMEV